MAQTRSWIEKAADQVLRHARASQAEADPIVCASGISPSGPIHLGNLREVMTVHLVAEELRQRGEQVEHIHSWDDFDRLRKVPAGVPPAFSDHIGRPLAEIPDPAGEFPSYADRFIAELDAELRDLKVSMRSIRQARAYRAGTYREAVKQAMSTRVAIFDILAAHQTAGRHQESLEQRRLGYYPFQVYCHACNRDSTTIRSYAEASATVDYTCTTCGHQASFSLDQETPGKLVWKVDWPMRWRFEQVTFEPGGEDHATEGSSYTVGKDIVRDVFGGTAPCFLQYAFVGIAGSAKISSSAGTSATPAAALRVLEPAMLRWLYVRRDARQQFTIDLGPGVVRLYDEWDRLVAQGAAGTISAKQAWIHRATTRTSVGDLLRGTDPVSFRLLSSAADIADGDVTQICRIVGEHTPRTGVTAKSLEPRLSCALHWLEDQVPAEERTIVRQAFHQEAWDALAEEEQRSVSRLVELFQASWGLDELTRLVYGVPKESLGRDLDAPPDDDTKLAQRSFFKTVYTLLIGKETGPRLPTLLLSIGQARATALLTGPPA
jgi:lysyl-tRNA synthetase class 1